jgi:proteasome lid subunit RPN8/RPN11
MKLTHSTLGYIGEWHSHPGVDTEKSADDIILHDSMKDYMFDICSPAVMIIVGSLGSGIYL